MGADMIGRGLPELRRFKVYFENLMQQLQPGAMKWCPFKVSVRGAAARGLGTRLHRVFHSPTSGSVSDKCTCSVRLYP